ncbi:MAG: 30S ribosomal protein S17 [Candidatus Micrarchaeota archaeon]
MAEECTDENCPTHGSLKTRGAIVEGTIVSLKAKKTAVIRCDYIKSVPKYERVEKRRGKLHIHVPPCMKVKVGDKVRAMECRKISKTKSHVVIK